MPLFAQYVATEDLVFTGEAFARQWQECLAERPGYAYTVPFPEDPTWPVVECYFSTTPFTKGELRQLCRYDYAPLKQRAQAGESIVGFKWRLEEVELVARTEIGEYILKEIGQEVVCAVH